MQSDLEPPSDKSIWLGLGATLSAIGASVCCVGPLLLLSLGIGGAWMSTLTSMESIRPFFIVLALIFIGLGFRKLYWLPTQCAADNGCAVSDSLRRQRNLFWIGSVLILMLLAFPWFAPYLLA
jgi:mercuric ion transport protein